MQKAPINAFHDDVDEDDDDDGCEIVKMYDNTFCTSFHVSQHYMGSIIGKKGATKARICRDTRTEIKIPRQGENKHVTISGPSISAVRAAKRMIDGIVLSSRRKQAITHFVSIPLNSPNIVTNFESFKESVLRECSDIEESLFISSKKLHLTVGVTCLTDKEEQILASKLLTEVNEKYLMPLLRDYIPFNIRLKGLSYMNDNPKAMKVLYGLVEEDGAPSGMLQRIADLLKGHFIKAGFMQHEFGRETVKLHVTFLNVQYSGKSGDKRATFDGSEILSKFADYDFGVTEMNNIQLSQLGTVGSDGYYKSTCVVTVK